jgi:hypothetical protein
MPAKVRSAQEGSGVEEADPPGAAAGDGLADAAAADGPADALAAGVDALGVELTVGLAAHPPSVRISPETTRRRPRDSVRAGVIRVIVLLVGLYRPPLPTRVTPRRRRCGAKVGEVAQNRS